MNPGKLNRRITIQEMSTHTRDSYGEVVPVWEDIDEVWAARRPLSASEQFASGQIYARASVLFSLRYRGLKPSNRIKYNREIYNIQSIIDVGDRHTDLQVLAFMEAT